MLQYFYKQLISLVLRIFKVSFACLNAYQKVVLALRGAKTVQ